MMGLSIGRWWQGVAAIERLGTPLWRRVSPLAQRFVPVQRLPQAVLLGMIWGWLPCGLVYSALAWAMVQGSPSQAIVLMGLFGLGTLPALLITGIAAQRIERLRKNLGFRRVAAVLLILYGVWTLPFVNHSLMAVL